MDFIQKFYTITFIVFYLNTCVFAQSNIWVKQIAATDLQLVQIAEDGQANLFVAGMFKDSLQLDSETLVIGSGPWQVFIAKYDNTQHLVDYTLIYTDYEFMRPLLRQMKIDNQGQLYLVGNFYQGLYDTQGDTLLYTLTSLDDYVIKFNNNLERQWIHQFGGSNNTDFISSISLTDAGEMILAGAMSRTFDYDLTDSVFAITGNNAGSPFIVKYDSDLGLQWVSVLPGAVTAYDWVIDAVPAADGGLYSVTRVSDTLLVPVEADTFLVETLGDVDLMVNKWSSSGEIEWTKLIQGTGVESLYNLEIDPAGFIYLFAQFGSPVLKIDTEEINQASGRDLIVAKFSPDGTIEWINQIDANSNDAQRKLFMLQDGFMLTGRYSADLSLRSRGEDLEINITTGEDFIATYHFDGTLLSATSLSGSNLPQKTDIKINESFQILTASSITSNASFNPLPTGTVTPVAGSNYVVAKFCFPIFDDLLIDPTCIEGQTTFTADDLTSSTSYYLTETDEFIADQDTFTVPQGVSSVVVITYDENQCPVYRSIDGLDQVCAVTPVADFDMGQHCTIFPNPFANNVELSWSNSVTLQTIRCFDHLGRVVFNTHIDSAPIANLTLDLSFLPEGLYHLHFETDAGRFTKTLIKS